MHFCLATFTRVCPILYILSVGEPQIIMGRCYFYEGKPQNGVGPSQNTIGQP